MHPFGRVLLYTVLTVLSAFSSLAIWFACVFAFDGGLQGIEHTCGWAPSARPLELRTELFPLRAECRYTDGSSKSLVPDAVNVVIFLAAGVTAAFFALLLRAIWRLGTYMVSVR
ncbi:hypothetical protein LWF15_12705 [Kineosporia rhizophila]|uniref:hypothetical protein n=1 Tax=Kineosporia rhizophila TaxID=84633 RepID=UPI001E59959C|nr:hypothetical protein [Kineosporia rhizophila]MCE0536371.1 hypothetical protein [Kineosporia rhizophila]